MPRYNGQSSAGVYFIENDLTQVVEQPAVGITVGGVVGETLIGPAFEPILVRNQTQFNTIFGGTSNERYPDGNPRYEAGYVSNYFLQEANQLWVCRLLGLSGYIDLNGDFLILTQGAFDPSTGVIVTSGSPVSVTASTASFGEITAIESSAAFLSSGATGTTTASTAIYGTGGSNPDLTAWTTSGWFVLSDPSVVLTSRNTWSGTGTTFLYLSFTGSVYNYNTVTTNVTGVTQNTNVNSTYPLITNGYFTPTTDPVRITTGATDYYTVTGSNSVFVSTSGNIWSYSSYTTTITGSPYAQYENMVAAVLRSKGVYTSNSTVATADVLLQTVTGITLSGGIEDFTLTVNQSGVTSAVTLECSLDRTDVNYIGKVIDRVPIRDIENTDQVPIYISEIYPETIKKLLTDGKINNLVNGTLTRNQNLGNWTVGYQTPITPYLVSELRGNKIYKLFRFVMIHDGNTANRLVKVSIQNINFDNREFDVFVRDYNDTDARPIVLETFTRCNLDPASNNYILKRIGDAGGYGTRSSYIYVELYSEEIPVDAVPSGFEGYTMKNYGDSSNIVPPAAIYKTQYFTNVERKARVYLGVSDNAYDSDNREYAGTNIDPDRYDYNAETITTVPNTSAVTYTKGFHMDRAVTATTYSGDFITTIYPWGSEIATVGSEIQQPRDRKYTVVVAGGFDGWDIYRSNRTWTDSYRINQTRYNNSNPAFNDVDFGEKTTDYYAYLDGINTFNNPESVPSNLFATAGINFSDNNGLVQDAISMIEDERADMLYLINAPDLPNTSDYSEQISDLLDVASLDTNYGATYGPWVQVQDPSSTQFLYIPPTAEVMRLMALTDNQFQPWFATGGLTRGRMTNVRNPRRKLKQGERDLMYDNRINPILRSSDGTYIWGQKTLQVVDSYLTQISVRRLLLYIQRACVQASRTLVFDPADTEFELQFRRIVTPILDNVQQLRGLRQYFIKTDDINNAQTRQRKQFFAQIWIIPIGAIEQIILQFNLTPEGFNFESVNQ